MTAESPRVVVREAARVILVGPGDRLLLFRAMLAHLRAGDGGRGIGITPGGGLEPGEAPIDGARRELWEETGIRAELGPCVWTRSYTFPWKDFRIEQREQYFFARTTETAVANANWTPEEHEFLAAHHWWSVDEVLQATDEVFVPRRIAHLLTPLLHGEMPPAPFDVGV